MQELEKHPRTSLLLMSIGLICFAVSVSAQSSPRQELQFKAERRAIAHGNEFNALALSADERRLFIGTEKGEIIVWNISERRIERKLNQGKPVHEIVALADPKFIIASGEEHLGDNIRSTVRKWNVENATFDDMPDLGDVPFVSSLSADLIRGFVAAAGIDGRLLVWDATSNNVIAKWDLKQIPISICIVGKKVYVSTADRKSSRGVDLPIESRIIELDIAAPQKAPQEFVGLTKSFWSDLKASPNGKMISALNASSDKEPLTLFDIAKKTVIATFISDTSAWQDDKNILIFSGLNPSEIVRISSDGSAKSFQTFKGERWGLDGPREFGLGGHVVLKDGSRAWSIYTKGAGFYQWDLKTKTAKVLISEHGGAYTLSVLPQSALILTGGLDGFIRLWNFADLSLRREFHVAAPEAFVTDAELLPGGKSAVVATMPMNWQEEREKSSTEIKTVNLETGEQKKLLTIDQTPVSVDVIGTDVLYSTADRIVLASTETAERKREFVADGPILSFVTSANHRWILAVEYTSSFCIFEIETGQRTVTQRNEPTQVWSGQKPLAISNDGRYVFLIGSAGDLTRWDSTTKQSKTMVLTKLRETHSRVDYMILAQNDEFLVTPGNHGDIGVYDSETGDLILHTRTPAAAFWIEKVWLSENRMIFTTDTGVMYSGSLSQIAK